LRAAPTLLRIGVAETVAYRAEFLVWILTTTMPLIMLGLWKSVADDGGPFQNYSSADFVAYFLAILVVRQLTGTWVAWQISEDIRTGAMAMRLLRPVHPFVAYALGHAAALPFRSIISVPVAILLLASSGASSLTSDPTRLALVVPSIALAWLITFGILFTLGSLGFWVTQTMAIVNVYLAIFMPLSGYLMPLDMLRPHFIAVIARYSPFRFMLSATVELVTKTTPAAELLLGQLAWAIVSVTLALWVWRRGVRHFEAVGS
jgi:ABC-2 type transport system permease protein